MHEESARNSASIVDIAILFCFLLVQAISELPRKIRKPVVDFLSESLPQSASQKAVSVRLSLPLRVSFKELVAFRYLRILFTDVQFCIVGDAIEEQTLDVAKDMSGLVATIA